MCSISPRFTAYKTDYKCLSDLRITSVLNIYYTGNEGIFLYSTSAIHLLFITLTAQLCKCSHLPIFQRVPIITSGFEKKQAHQVCKSFRQLCIPYAQKYNFLAYFLKHPQLTGFFSEALTHWKAARVHQLPCKPQPSLWHVCQMATSTSLNFF